MFCLKWRRTIFSSCYPAKLILNRIIRIVIIVQFVFLAFLSFSIFSSNKYLEPQSPFKPFNLENETHLNYLKLKMDFNHHSNNFIINNNGVLFCKDKDYVQKTSYEQRGPYYVIYNYFKATKTFSCGESITYTTHSDWTFLDNLVPLLERWQGPLSLTLYAPGTDFEESVRRIQFLRECISSQLVKEFVSFHLFFEEGYAPIQVSSRPETIPVDCKELNETITFGEHLQTFKKAEGLLYPVNVGRNVAKEQAATYFVLPSDIELYPSPGLIPEFLEMIKRNETVLQRPNPKVFVLPIFEVQKNIPALPKNKTELIKMLKKKVAIPFHKHVCSHCHSVPKAVDWKRAKVRKGMNVFYVGKRYKPYHHWEPIFIGSKFDPFYDERLSWEGRSDKMTQGHILCLLDYEFHILDNAFLVHRPGIKRLKKGGKISGIVRSQYNLVKKKILVELETVFGNRTGCTMTYKK